MGMKDFQDTFAGEENPTLRLRFAGDGRKTSKKIGTVMGVFSVLQEAEKGLHRPDYQYTICLYNGKLFTCYFFIFSGESDSLVYCIFQCCAHYCGL